MIVVELGSHLEQFVKKQIETGRYKSENDLFKASISLLEKEGQKELAEIRKALVDGENSGDALPFDNEAFKAEMKIKYAFRAH